MTVLKNLTHLNLTWTELTDAGLKELATMESLTSLSMSGIRKPTGNGLKKLTDAGVKELAALKNLTHLGLLGAEVTDDGIEKLRAALPKCEVVSGK